MSELRFKVVEEAIRRKAVCLPATEERPSEMFGKNVFDEEKILLDCTLSDSTVIHLRTDYRNFTLGSPGIFPGPGIWSYHEIFCLHLFSCLEIEYQLDDSVGVALCGQMLQDQSDDHKYLLQ